MHAKGLSAIYCKMLGKVNKPVTLSTIEEELFKVLPEVNVGMMLELGKKSPVRY
jgi:hypothetical protein